MSLFFFASVFLSFLPGTFFYLFFLSFFFFLLLSFLITFFFFCLFTSSFFSCFFFLFYLRSSFYFYFLFSLFSVGFISVYFSFLFFLFARFHAFSLLSLLLLSLYSIFFFFLSFLPFFLRTNHTMSVWTAHFFIFPFARFLNTLEIFCFFFWAVLSCLDNFFFLSFVHFFFQFFFLSSQLLTGHFILYFPFLVFLLTPWRFSVSLFRPYGMVSTIYFFFPSSSVFFFSFIFLFTTFNRSLLSFFPFIFSFDSVEISVTLLLGRVVLSRQFVSSFLRPVFFLPFRLLPFHKISSAAARVFLTLSRHLSQPFITSERSSGLHPVFSQSCCM